MHFLSDRLKQARIKSGLTQRELAKQAGVSLRALINWESGSVEPSIEGLRKVCTLMHVEMRTLYGDAPISSKQIQRKAANEDLLIGESNVIARVEVRKVPVVSWTAAGEAHNYEDLANQIGEFVETESRDPNAFALIVEGHSMEKEVFPGDIVIFSPNSEARNGDIVVARIRENGVTLKKFSRKGPAGKIIELASINPEYPTKEYPQDEFEFIYPAVELKRQFRRRL